MRFFSCFHGLSRIVGIVSPQTFKLKLSRPLLDNLLLISDGSCRALSSIRRSFCCHLKDWSVHPTLNSTIPPVCNDSLGCTMDVGHTSLPQSASLPSNLN